MSDVWFQVAAGRLFENCGAERSMIYTRKKIVRAETAADPVDLRLSSSRPPTVKGKEKKTEFLSVSCLDRSGRIQGASVCVLQRFAAPKLHSSNNNNDVEKAELPSDLGGQRTTRAPLPGIRRQKQQQQEEAGGGSSSSSRSRQQEGDEKAQHGGRRLELHAEELRTQTHGPELHTETTAKCRSGRCAVGTSQPKPLPRAPPVPSLAHTRPSQTPKERDGENLYFQDRFQKPWDIHTARSLSLFRSRLNASLSPSAYL
ncbi:unnamed protein product [Lampetra fluviatilis]